MNKQIIILAAGKGSRMNSDLPKVMHKVGGTPMLERVFQNCQRVTDDLVLVYSDHLKPYLGAFENKCKLALQEQQLGTAHAVFVAKEFTDPHKYNAVIYGDNPLITDDIIQELFDYTTKNASAVVTLAFEYDKPNQYGRIIIDKNGNFQKIVESKFANSEEIKVTLCNSGIMVFAPGILEKYLPKCLEPDPKHPEKELYLTRIIDVCNAGAEKVSYFLAKDASLLLGVNTKEELVVANKTANVPESEKWLSQGDNMSRLDKALDWAAKNEPKNNFEEIAKKIISPKNPK